MKLHMMPLPVELRDASSLSSLAAFSVNCLTVLTSKVSKVRTLTLVTFLYTAMGPRRPASWIYQSCDVSGFQRGDVDSGVRLYFTV